LPWQEYGTRDQVFKICRLYIETGSRQTRDKDDSKKENDNECHCK